MTAQDTASRIAKVSRDEADAATLSAALADGRSVELIDILSAVNETAYVWSADTDSLDWERNAAQLLGVSDPSQIATMTAFERLVAPEHAERRRNAMADGAVAVHSTGCTYRVQYRFMPGGRRTSKSVWIEDRGCCWLDDKGLPVRARGVMRVISDRNLEEQQHLQSNDLDELTGQLNRIRLTEALGTIVRRSQETKQPAAFLMVAVDNLAHINETFGFDVGDEVLAAVAQILRRHLRGGDSIGRYSSNKFGMILNECGPGAMRIAAERFLKAVRDTTISTTACKLSATLSIGGVQIPDDASSTNQALSNALQALDRAKFKRNGCFMAYERSPHQETVRRRNINVADEVIAALQENRILLALQPIMRTDTREPAHYECLLRLQKPDGTIVSAGEFIPVAEQLGLSRLLDRRALELAVALAKELPSIKLTLNVSGHTASDHDWLVAMHRLTGGRRHIIERFTIEITETAAIGDLDQTINFVDTLKELGCKVAIDDFGAGYTSFKNLKLLPVDMVKIDGSFVKDLANEDSDRIFIKTLTDLAKSFGLETVAEWVGDEATAEILAEIGVTYLQGFLFGKPLMSDELVEMLKVAQPVA